jgi:UDP-2,3-diacylglucosamine pyrophosphatase LpxH
MATDPEGFFDSKVVEAYLNEKGDLYNRDNVEYWFDPAKLRTLTAKKATVWKDGTGGKQSFPGLGQCLFMDVGCWAGNGSKSKQNHQRHREFGVVCGDVAVLCSFPEKATEVEFGLPPAKKVTLEASGGLPTYEKRIEPLLKHLSKAGLGNVSVMNALAVNDDGLPGGRWWERDPTIHVFLGDFHLPVITEKESTYLGPKHGPYVPRAGRLDLSDRVKAQAAAAAAVAAASWWVPAPKVSASLIGFSGGVIWEEEQIKGWDAVKTDGFMKKEEAEAWADFYLGKNGEKGAEIFQGAADDLVAFLAQLEDFARENPESQLHLVQTGDFLDFWIGFKCGFGEKAILNRDAKEFVKFWYDRTAQNKRTGGQRASGNRAGDVLAAFHRLRSASVPDVCSSNLQVTLLHGNHDNYLRTGHDRKAAHCPEGSIVFAEHGHQSDGFNSDDEPRWGWALTQAAFLWPSIRDKEDSLAAGLTEVKRTGGVIVTDPGARLQRVARGADVCLKEGRSIYVLGHTHQAMLKKVSLRPKLTTADVCESELQCAIAWSDALCAHANRLAKTKQEEAQRANQRLKEAAHERYMKGLGAARRGILETRRELERLRAQGKAFGHERMEEARRKVTEIERELERLDNAGEAYARKKAEEVRQQIVAAQADLEYVAEIVKAHERYMMGSAQRKVAQSQAELVRLGEVSDAYAREKVKVARRFLEEEQEAARTALTGMRSALQEAQATARKRAKGALADLHAKATLAEGRVKAALGSLFGQ